MTTIIVQFLVFAAFLFCYLDNRRRARLKTKGVILEVWNKYSGAAFAVGLVLVGSYLKIPKEEFIDFWGNLGGLIKYIDGIVGVAALLYPVLIKWLKKADEDVE